MKKLILPLLIVALTLPVAAMACPGSDKGKGMHGGHFEKMDTNGDGAVSVEEHASFAAQRFSKMDANGDGMLTKDEITKNRKGKWQGKHKDCPLKEDCSYHKECPKDPKS